MDQDVLFLDWFSYDFQTRISGLLLTLTTRFFLYVDYQFVVNIVIFLNFSFDGFIIKFYIVEVWMFIMHYIVGICLWDCLLYGYIYTYRHVHGFDLWGGGTWTEAGEPPIPGSTLSVLRFRARVFGKKFKKWKKNLNIKKNYKTIINNDQ